VQVKVMWCRVGNPPVQHLEATNWGKRLWMPRQMVYQVVGTSKYSRVAFADSCTCLHAPEAAVVNF
jgi:hypothetical protein